MGQNSKVLVVDDDQYARHEIVTYLNHKGFECLEADNGISALDLLKCNAEIDVVLTDIRMPVLDGLEFIRYARQGDGNILEFVVMTGYGTKEDAIDALKLAASDFIEKPLNLSEMWRSVERAAMNAAVKRSQRNIQTRGNLQQDWM